MDGGNPMTREVSGKNNFRVQLLDLKSCKSFNHMSTKHCKDIKMQFAMTLSSKCKYNKYLWQGFDVSPSMNKTFLRRSKVQGKV